MKSTIVVLSLLLAAAATAVAAEHQILVTPPWVAERLNDPNLVVLQVVSLRADYVREHLPGARMLWQYSIYESTPDRNSEPLKLPILDSVLKEVGVNNDSRIVLCHTLGDVGAVARIYVVLDWLGLGDQTFILNGGFEAWKAAGLPVTKDLPKVNKGNFTPRLRPDVFAELDYVRTHYRDNGVKMVDCRTPQGFDGSPGVNIYRSGHIPGAINIPATIVTDTTYRFRPLDSIDLKIVDAGIRRTDEVIIYCWVGTTACREYVALKSLGYKVRLYDGSFEEWSRIDELPVEVTPPKVDEKPKGN